MANTTKNLEGHESLTGFLGQHCFITKKHNDKLPKDLFICFYYAFCYRFNLPVASHHNTSKILASVGVMANKKSFIGIRCDTASLISSNKELSKTTPSSQQVKTPCAKCTQTTNTAKVLYRTSRHASQHIFKGKDSLCEFLSKVYKVTVTSVSQPSPATPVSQPIPATPQPRPATPVSQPSPATPVSQPIPASPQPRPATPVSQPSPATPVSQPRPATPVSQPSPATPVSQPSPATPESQSVIETSVPHPNITSDISSTPTMPLTLPAIPFFNQGQSQMPMPFLPVQTNNIDPALNQLFYSLSMSYMYYTLAVAKASQEHNNTEERQ
ncbi:hypothetical protein Pcinc_028881 [Petrolisthes cinctipes]|uniref:Uncharacterized protein n=1 Tax=Petrolisthes cinctipes TaxID=88211 RepID=A0AAE1K8B9_PETCI|nr:hypothetical protein Pcinc_028881 [Petrolisthes cinctipes]